MTQTVFARLREAVELGLPVQLTRQETAAVVGEFDRLESLLSARHGKATRVQKPRLMQSVRMIEAPDVARPKAHP
jgi:hypothetical protein